jgi:Arc/MetJ-type ribon-helix-helix transcriptional regulator
MTIHLPEDMERFINEAVHRGHFASVDDAMAEAARLLLHKLSQAPSATKPAASEEPPAKPYKPIWEVAADIRKSIPAEEWAKLPKDGAEQLDHYIYGTPKRPQAQ